MTKFSTIAQDLTKIRPWLRELRIWILKERCKKTAEALPVFVRETLSLAPGRHHELLTTPVQKLFFQFSKHHTKFLVSLPSDVTAFQRPYRN